MRKLLLLIAVIASCSLSVESQNLLAGWDGNGVTGTASKPNDVGWLNNVTASIPWTVANGSGGCRFRDSGVTGGYAAGSFTYESGVPALTSRQLMFRWDATAYSTSYYAYPVILEACSTYIFSFDYCYGGSGSAGLTLTAGISTTANGTDRLSSKTFTTTAASVLRTGTYTFSTGATAGTYYMTFNGAWAWFGVANLSLKKYSNKLLDVATGSLALTNVNKTANFTIAGNALPNAINITAPAGITLSKTSVTGAEAQCGVQITATYNYTQPSLTKDTIVVTTDTVGGTITKKIPFTYTKPTINVFERSIEIENNGKSYPLAISSVNNTVDSVYVYGTTGFTVAKRGYAASDFVNNYLSVDVTSSAAEGETGKLIFKGPQNVLIDSILVKKVAPYTRYYIRQNTSQLVFGSTNAGAFPVLTTQNGLSSQKFIFRKVNVNPASTIDTVYIVQDSLYRTLRKSSANAWDSDLGIPSANSKWVVQSQGNNIVSLLNTVSGKVIGTDALTANSRMYVDKTWVAGNNTEWILVDAGVSTAVNKTNAVSPTVIVDHKSLRVLNAASYAVYNVQGVKVMDVSRNTAETSVVLNQGIYIVKTSNGVTKVIVE